MPRKQRFTYLSLICYTEHDVNMIVADKVVERYAYIFHQPEGEKKQPHFHVVLKLSEQVSADYFVEKKAFLENVRCVGVLKRSGALTAFEYLVHKNDPEKIQYNLSDVVTNDLNWWLNLRSAHSRADNSEFLADLLLLSVVDLARKYGRDFIKNVDRYLQFKRCYLNNEIREVDNDVDIPPDFCVDKLPM